ncbi:MAG: amidase [Actinobacteria bacterium]|nr:amidase [Actinomycetota bacterium]
MLTELAAQVRAGSIDPVDLVEESLDRIGAAVGLNAVVAVHADEARATARSHDRRGALAGLPFLVKDMARVAGHVTTLGSRLYEHGPADQVDDVLVARLRGAGAILIGRTNSPEFGATAFTSNDVFGATRNPWNTAMSPGGSSGGSTAALAAGLAPIATTSDGGGSVRAPAALSGLVGYKPTMGAIGRNILPRWIGFSTQGTTGASVADVVTESSVTIGETRGDWLSVPRAGLRLAPEMPSRVLACRTFRTDVDPDIEANFERTLAALAADGVRIERIDPPSDNETMRAWFVIATAELRQSLLHEEHRWDQMTDYVQNQLHFAATVTIEAYIAAQRKRHEVSARFDDLLGGDAVIVVPTANARAWPAEGPLPQRAGSTDDSMAALNTPDSNFTGHPAVSVPMGLDDNGVPCGFQIVAPRFADGLALGLAARIEAIQPWPLTAPGYESFSL